MKSCLMGCVYIPSFQGVAPFQDLLSAALDESGLADDFQDFGSETAAPAQPEIVQSSVLVQPQHVTAIPRLGVRLGTPAQQVPQQVARVIRTIPASAASPAAQGNIRRVLVRAVPPRVGIPNQQTVQVVNSGVAAPTPRLQQAQVISGNTVHTGQVQVVQGPSGPLKIIRVTPKNDAVAASTVSVAGLTPASTSGQQVRTVLQVARPAASTTVTTASVPQVPRVVQVAGNTTTASPVVVNVGGGVKRHVIQANQAPSPVTATTVDATGVRRQIIRLDGTRGAALSQAPSQHQPQCCQSSDCKSWLKPTFRVNSSPAKCEHCCHNRSHHPATSSSHNSQQ